MKSIVNISTAKIFSWIKKSVLLILITLILADLVGVISTIPVKTLDWKTIAIKDFPSGDLPRITAIITSQDNTTLVAGTSNYGILVSQDHGSSWYLSNTGLESTNVISVLVHPRENVIFAGTDKGVFSSRNNGLSWTAANNGLSSVEVQRLVFGPNGTDLFLTISYITQSDTAGKVYRSQDNGRSWELTNSGIESVYVESLGSLSDGKTIFASASDTQGGLYQSNDNGNTWQKTEQLPSIRSADFINVIAGEYAHLFANTSVEETSSDGNKRSVPGPVYWFNQNNSQWEPVKLGTENDPIRAITALPNTNGLIALTDSGIYESENGKTWTSIDNYHNLPILQAISIAYDSATNNLIIGTSNGFYQSKDHGINWEELNNGVKFTDVDFVATAENDSYAVTSQGVIFSSADDGSNWSLFPFPASLNYVRSISGDANNNDTFFASDFRSIQYTVDHGKTWMPIHRFNNSNIRIDDHYYVPENRSLLVITAPILGTTQPTVWYSNGDFENFKAANFSSTSEGSVEVDGVDKFFRVGNTIYLAKSRTGNSEGAKLYYSTDWGQNWDTLSSEKFGSFDSLIQSSDGRRLFAVTTPLSSDKKVIEYSDDGGISWVMVSDSLEEVEVNQVAVGPDKKSIFASSQNRGIFVTNDNGIHWSSRNVGLDALETINSLSVNYDKHFILIGTTRGMFRSTDAGQTWQKADKGINDIYIKAMAVDNNGILYAASKMYVAKSENGTNWQRIGTLSPYLYIDQLFIIPGTNNLVAKGSYPVGSEIDLYESEKGVWREIGGRSQEQPCSYDCMLTISPDGKSLWAIDYDRQVFSFNVQKNDWEQIITVEHRGGPDYVKYLAVDASGKKLIASDYMGTYELDPENNSGRILKNLLEDEFNAIELPANYFYEESRIMLSNDRLSIGRSTTRWLPFVSLTGYRPIALRIHDGTIIFYGTPGADSLLQATQELPFFWPASNTYLSFVSNTWGIIDWGIANPAWSLSGLAFVLIFLISVVFVNNSYLGFKRRFDTGNSLEKFMVMSLPVNSEWNIELLKAYLNSRLLIIDSFHLVTALNELQKRDLLIQKNNGFKISEPAIALLFRLSKSKSSLENLAEQIRHEHPLVLATKEFLLKSGFTVTLTGPYGFLCSSKSPFWRDITPLYVHIVVESQLTLEEFQRVTKAANEAYKKYPQHKTILIVLDRSPHASDLYQIFAQKAQKGFNIVPISFSTINLAVSEATEIETLRDQVDTYSGRSDLYDIRSSVSDVLSFFGRSSTLAELQAQLMNGRSAMIFGIRKIGKSSLMNRVKEESNWITAFLDLEGYSVGLKYAYDDIMHHWANSFLSRYPHLTLPEIISTANLDSRERIQYLRAFVEKMFGILDENKDSAGVSIFLDEMDILLQQQDYIEFASILRSLSEDMRWKGRFSLLMAGLDPSLNRLDRIGGGRNPFYQYFIELPIGPLHQDDTKTMIVSIGGQMGISYTDSGLDLITKASGGHPFIARQLCSQAITNIERPGEIDENLASLAIESYLSNSRNYLSESLWAVDSGGPGSEETTLLKSLSEREYLTEEELVPSKVSGKNHRKMQLAFDRLADMSLIKQIDLHWSISLPIYREWIQRNILGIIKG